MIVTSTSVSAQSNDAYWCTFRNTEQIRHDTGGWGMQSAIVADFRCSDGNYYGLYTRQFGDVVIYTDTWMEYAPIDETGRFTGRTQRLSEVSAQDDGTYVTLYADNYGPQGCAFKIEKATGNTTLFKWGCNALESLPTSGSDTALFDDYCPERWDLGQARAYQLIEAA